MSAAFSPLPCPDPSREIERLKRLLALSWQRELALLHRLARRAAPTRVRRQRDLFDPSN